MGFRCMFYQSFCKKWDPYYEPTIVVCDSVMNQQPISSKSDILCVEVKPFQIQSYIFEFYPPTEVIIKLSGMSLTAYNYRVQLIEFLMLGSFVSIQMAQ